jgi:putative tricarboxylic transport membrane protein
MDAVTGDARYYFGSVYLVGGLNFIPLVVGFIGMSQVYEMTVERTQDKVEGAEKIRLRFRDCFLSSREWKRILPPAVRSGLMGSVIGVVPGTGATMAAFLGYAVQKKIGKNEVEPGKGAIEGVAASEAANNAAAAGAFGPLLSLGIPGSGTTAVLLGGLMMWGLTPGPRLFTDHPDFAWGLIASLYVANLVSLLIAFAIIPWIMRIIVIPSGVMIPCIVAICFVSGFATSNTMFSVIVMVVGGILGYFFKKFQYPVAPMLLSFILASMLEVNMRRAFLISKGSPALFFTKPMSLAFLILFAVIISAPLVRKWRAKRKAGQ